MHDANDMLLFDVYYLLKTKIHSVFLYNHSVKVLRIQVINAYQLLPRKLSQDKLSAANFLIQLG